MAKASIQPGRSREDTKPQGRSRAATTLFAAAEGFGRRGIGRGGREDSRQCDGSIFDCTEAQLRAPTIRGGLQTRGVRGTSVRLRATGHAVCTSQQHRECDRDIFRPMTDSKGLCLVRSRRSRHNLSPEIRHHPRHGARDARMFQHYHREESVARDPATGEFTIPICFHCVMSDTHFSIRSAAWSSLNTTQNSAPPMEHLRIFSSSPRLSSALWPESTTKV